MGPGFAGVGVGRAQRGAGLAGAVGFLQAGVGVLLGGEGEAEFAAGEDEQRQFEGAGGAPAADSVDEALAGAGGSWRPKTRVTHQAG